MIKHFITILELSNDKYCNMFLSLDLQQFIKLTRISS